MTDRTCLDVAAEAIHEVLPRIDQARWTVACAALDAIHPALANLTPDDVETTIALRQQGASIDALRARLATAEAALAEIRTIVDGTQSAVLRIVRVSAALAAHAAAVEARHAD